MSKLHQAACLGLTFALCLRAGGTGYCPPGDSYDGEVVSESDQGITINTQPCTSAKHLVSLRYYRKDALSDVACPGVSGRKYKQIRIEEVAPPATARPEPKTAPEPDPKKNGRSVPNPNPNAAPKLAPTSRQERPEQKPPANPPAL